MISEQAASVLIVDDDPVIRTLVRHGLRKLGVQEVLEASDGEAAKAVLTEKEVDLAIVDLIMPQLDGLGLIRWSRERVPHRREGDRPGPVWIILSAIDTFDAAVEAIEVGAFAFLSKPPKLPELEVVVRNALEHRHLLQERARLFAELEEANRQLARQVRELEEKSEVISRDLRRAEVIQRVLLPAEPTALERHTVNSIYRAGRHVGGDLYHVLRIEPRHLVVYIADATGHGVSSAMLSVLFQRCLVTTDDDGRPLSPSQVLERVNLALCQNRPGPGLFLTAAYALLDLESDELVLAGAGHPPVFHAAAGGEIRRISRTGPALGLTFSAQYGEERVRLGAADRLLLFTDGLLQGVSDEERAARLSATLARRDLTGHALLETLISTADGAGSPADDRDDTTVLLLEASAGESRFDNGAQESGGAAGSATPAARARESGAVWYGDSEDGAFLALRGRGTWTDCDAFNETARNLLDAGRPLVLDLSACEYLDSTFLGTIHELMSRAGGGRADGLRLQGVSEPIRQAFEELSMEGVLQARKEPALPLPTQMQPLASGAMRETESQRRILQAHEALAALSARNQEKFLAVVETLRSQTE